MTNVNVGRPVRYLVVAAALALGSLLLPAGGTAVPPGGAAIGAAPPPAAAPPCTEQLKDSLRPPNIHADAWGAVFANLVAQTGTTWGAFVKRLDDNASYLFHLGEKVVDIGQLWQFELEQGNWLNPVKQLGGAVDAAVPAPGLPLSFSRVFSPSLIGRYQLGRLGRGWSDSWQVSLSIDPDGTSVWVAERCGESIPPSRINPALSFACDGSKLDPVLKFDPSGNLAG